MATSGSKSISVTSYDTLKFSWSTSSQSIANNTSTVSWKMQLISDANGKISSTASKDWSVTVNGTKYSGTNTVGIAASTTKTLASGTTTIAHNSDGTKTFNYSFSQEFAITFSGSSVGTKSGSGTGTLDTIPRKSTMSVGNGTLGTAQTLTVTRKSTNFTHTITATCGSASTTIRTKSTDTSISFTPPLSWASQNTTGTSVSVKYTITTYSGSTSIGSNSYTVTCSIPASVKPSVSLTVSDPTGYLSTYGGYVQGLSKFTVSVSASGSYSSTIKSYKTTANGGTYTASSFTTGVITSSGTLTVSTTVTDSRSRTTTVSKNNLTVLAYTAPKISSMSVYRASNTSGTSDANGAYLAVKFSPSYTSLNGKNTATYTLKYKKTSETTYSTKTLTASEVSAKLVTFEADTTSSYNVTLTLADDFKSVSSNGTGSSASKTMSLYKEGKGVAFGKNAETENALETSWNIKGLKTDNWLGKFRFNGEWIGLYDTSNGGTRKGWIGHNDSTNLTFKNEAGGYIKLVGTTMTVGDHYFIEDRSYYIKSGVANLQNITANGTLKATGATTLQSTLAVTGNTTVGGTLQSTGAATLKSTLAVTGASTLTGGFTAKDTSYFQKSAIFSNACYVRGYTSKNAESVLIGMGSSDWIAVGQSDYILGLRGSSVRLGSSSGTVVTSDRNLKKDIEDIDDRYIEFFKKLRPVTYKYEIGRTGRPHIGFIAQEVEEALNDSELTTADFGGICVDDVVYTEENKDDEFDDMNYAYNKGLKQVYSLRYEEFISLNSKMIQEVMKENEVLKTEIDSLKEENKQIKEEMQQLKEMVSKIVS